MKESFALMIVGEGRFAKHPKRFKKTGL